MESLKSISYNLRQKSLSFFKDYFNISIFKLSFYDFSKIYKGSVLGVFWTFFKPIFTTCLFYIGNIFINPDFATTTTSTGFPNWMSLIVGMLLWTYLSEAFSGNATILTQYSFLITKMKYKKSKIYMFANISKFFQHFVLMCVFFIVYLILYFSMTGNIGDNMRNSGQLLYLLQLPVIAIMMLIFFTCWSSFIAPITVISSDMNQVVILFVTSVFWISGTFFDVNSLLSDANPSGINLIMYHIICLNPLATFVSLFKSTYVGSIDYTGTNPDLGNNPNMTLDNFEWFYSGHWEANYFVGYWYKVILIFVWCLIFVLLTWWVNSKTKEWLNDLF